MKRAPPKRKPLLDVVEIFCSFQDCQWYWRQRAANGNIRADGGEGYRTRAGAQIGFERHRAKLVAGEYVVRFVE